MKNEMAKWEKVSQIKNWQFIVYCEIDHSARKYGEVTDTIDALMSLLDGMTRSVSMDNVDSSDGTDNMCKCIIAGDTFNHPEYPDGVPIGTSYIKEIEREGDTLRIFTISRSTYYLDMLDYRDDYIRIQARAPRSARIRRHTTPID